jgi:bifunctional ADP-heptose synthase (sugar kinase/adenylyltransferase)
MRVLERYGGRIHFTSGDTFSSTKLSHFLLASPEAAQRDPLLRNDRVLFRDVSSLGFTLEQLKRFVADASALRVCVIGETIIDEWVDVTVTNLSTQSRCVAGQEVSRVRQIGGAGIVARHLSNFVKSVECFTNEVPGDLGPNVQVTNIAHGQLIETRFVDCATRQAVFKSRSRGIADVRSDFLPDCDAYDLVLIADYGHGLLDEAAINRRIAERRGGFVSAMAQVNSSNYGYNLPTKYKDADYYSLNRTEAELCLQARDLELPELLERLAVRLGHSVAVTDGAHGSAVMIGATRFTLPSLSVSVVDTVGCGDAFFALSSAATCLEYPAGLVALVGSIGAAAMTQRRANESPVTEHEFLTIGKIVI